MLICTLNALSSLFMAWARWGMILVMFQALAREPMAMFLSLVGWPGGLPGSEGLGEQQLDRLAPAGHRGHLLGRS
jgi:hypothetical protein